MTALQACQYRLTGLRKAPLLARQRAPSVTRTFPVPGATLQSSVNYASVPAGEELFVKLSPPEDATERVTNAESVAHKVEIEDARRRLEPFELHEHGFTLVNFEVPPLDWKNQDEVKAKYYPAALQLVKELSGATRVHPVEHILRRGRVKTANGMGDPDEPAIMQPTNGLHVDFTTESGPLRLAWALPEEADELKQHSFAIIQVWRPIVGPVEESPLTFVDVNSVDNKQDLVYGRLDYPNEKQSSFYAMQHNPGHKFYYYKGMTTSEAAVFKCYDSRSQGTARFTPHCAFHDPTTPESAPERFSIEFRALAFFEDQA